MFERILLSTDFSEQAEVAYPWAAKMASIESGSIVLMHALEDDLVATAPVFAGYMAPGALDLGSYREEFRAGAKRALEAAAERLRALGATVEPEFLMYTVAASSRVLGAIHTRVMCVMLYRRAVHACPRRYVYRLCGLCCVHVSRPRRSI